MMICLNLGAKSAFAAEPAPPDIEAGRALAAPCVVCHGESGNSPLAINPNLAGQNARYLFRQMQLIRDGGREAPLMTGQLDGLSDAKLIDLAAFYESQVSQVGQAPAEMANRGQAIYRGGILHKGVAACTACHAPDGSGNPLAGFPSLSGQHPEYVIDQLVAYREGRRTTDEEYGGMMRQTAHNMTDGDIAAVAHYLFGLH